MNVEDTVHLAIIGLLKYVGSSEDCSMLQDKHLGTLKRQRRRRDTKSGERMSESRSGKIRCYMVNL